MVTLKASHVVKPAESTPEEVMYLSDCDQIKPLTHAPTVYFYKPTTHKSLEEAIQLAKDSLSKALVTFYPLAGRLHWTNGGRVELHCNSMGALVIEAESDLTIDDFGDFRPTPEIRSLVPSVDYTTTPIHEVPLLLAQVTKFSCGGISLGVGVSHILVDGLSAVHFVMEWAKIARGEQSDDHPFLDRKILQQDEHQTLSLPNMKYSDFFPLPLLLGQTDNLEERKKETTAIMMKLSKEQIEALRSKVNQDLLTKEQVEALKKFSSTGLQIKDIKRLMETDQKEQKANIDPDGKERMEALKGEGSQEKVETLGNMTRQQLIEALKSTKDFQTQEDFDTVQSNELLESLKNKANPELHSKELISETLKNKVNLQYSFSRFEAVCAHIWKCVSMARGLKPEQETVLFVTVDFRNRIKPPLPKRYFGNAVMPLPVSSTVGELLSNPLSYAARKIRTAILSVTDEYVRSYLQCIKNIPNISSKRHFHTVGCAQGSFFGNPNLIITSWVGLPIYGAKFWGDEVFLGPASLGYDGRVFLIPCQSGDGSFIIPMRLQVEHVSAFEKYFYEEI